MLPTSLRSVFKKKLNQLQKSQLSVQLCRVLSDLPQPLQNHFKYCGYSADESTRLVTIDWKNAELRFSPNGKWIEIACDQINVLTEPVRLVYMRKKLFGLLSFGTIDIRIEDYSKVLIKPLKLFTWNHAVSAEINQAELVTVLAETMLIPAYALQHYITWEEINPRCVKGIITYKGGAASGLFHFGELGEIICFETNDRFFTPGNGQYERTKWIARIDHYEKQNGRMIPSGFSATWKLPGIEFEYFRGTIGGIYSAPFETYCVGSRPRQIVRQCKSPRKPAFP